MRNPFKHREQPEPKPAPFTPAEIELERQAVVESYNQGHISLTQLRASLSELKALEAELGGPRQSAD